MNLMWKKESEKTYGDGAMIASNTGHVRARTTERQGG